MDLSDVDISVKRKMNIYGMVAYGPWFRDDDTSPKNWTIEMLVFPIADYLNFLYGNSLCPHRFDNNNRKFEALASELR